MALNGWIKVHRQLLEHWVSQEPELFAFWMRLLLEANHAEVKRMFNGSLITIERGQVIFGLEAFEAKSGISKKKLRRYLDLLQNDGMIGRQATNKYSIITIANYNDYQEEGRQEAGKGQAEGKPRASQGQHRKNVKNGENVENTNTPLPPRGESVPFQDIVNLYHEHLPMLPRVANVSEPRKRAMRARWSEKVNVPNGKEVVEMKCNDLDFWARYFKRAATQPFLTGEKTDWAADFDFLLKKNKFIAVLEQKYLRD